MNSRREFLGLGFGFACSCAVGDVCTNMVGRMAPRSQTIVEPWNGGRLRVSSFTVNVGATKPFRAVHFSDTHINLSDIEEMYASERNYVAGTKRYARFPQAIPSFYATLDFAAKEPDTLLLHTGDLIDFGTQACYDFVRHNLKGRNVHYAIGNHEFELPDSSYAPDSGAQVRALAATGAFGDLSCCSRVVNGVNFVAFDNACNGKGVVRPSVREAVCREFAKGLPVVLMCHVPFYTPKHYEHNLKSTNGVCAYLTGIPDELIDTWAGRDDWSEDERWRDRRVQQRPDGVTKDFISYLKAQPLLKAVLTGHCHGYWEERFSPTAVQYTCSATYKGECAAIDFV